MGRSTRRISTVDVERLRLLLERLPAVVWTTDDRLRFTSSLGAGLRGLGLKPGQVVGMTLAEYFRTDDPSYPNLVKHRLALRGRKVSYETEWEGRTWHSHVEPLLDRKDRTIGTIGVALDITERKRAERELKRREEEVITFNDLLTHDVTNFTTTLLAIVERLLMRKDGSLSKSQANLLQRANRQLFELGRLSENAKLLAVIRRKGMPHDLGPQRLVEVLGRAVETVRSVHFDRRFKVDVRCPKGLVVRGGPLLFNVFVNLVDNAVRHTPGDRSPRLGIQAAREGSVVRVRVRGGPAQTPGISATSGTRLGLKLVTEIVERSGGRVSVGIHSPGPEGVFEVTLVLPRA